MTSQSDGSPAPRPRGRPFGARDSYPRQRRASKLAPRSLTEATMPAVHELVDAAHNCGYVRGLGRSTKRADEALARAEKNLLGIIAQWAEECGVEF